ncbi:hypothetical protein FRC17_006972, partial [Serendipita sp. 399]
MESKDDNAPIPLQTHQAAAGPSRTIVTEGHGGDEDIIVIHDEPLEAARSPSRQSLPPAYSKAQVPAPKPHKRAQRSNTYPPRRTRSTLRDLQRSRSSFRHALFLLMERPTSSNSAFILHFTTNTIIVLSAILTILETLPSFHAVKSSIWFGLETVIVALFTVEYVARSFAWGFGESNGGWRRWSKWVTSFFALIDLFAILPYYIELILQADTTAFFRFSILRVFRLLRVFRPFRYSSTILLTIEVMILATRRSQHALLALLFFIVMMLVVFSTLLYFIERGTWDDALETFVDAEGVKTQFDSIPMAAWFVLVTITTTGYGDIVPRTFFGRLMTVPLLLFGLLLVALPSFVLGREFAIVWEEMSAGVLDRSILQIGREPESPLTPRTGRAAERYAINTMPNNDSEFGRYRDRREITPLTAGGKGKGRAKEMLFDAGDEDLDDDGPDHGEPSKKGKERETRAKEHDEEQGLQGVGDHMQLRHDRNAEMERRRQRVESDADGRTNAFMGLTHRRNTSQVHLLGGSTSTSSFPAMTGITSAVESQTKA